MRVAHRAVSIALGVVLATLPVSAALAEGSGDAMIVQRITAVYGSSFTDLDTLIDGMRADGMGWGQIIMVLDLAKLSGMSIDDIRAKLAAGEGFGQIAQDLGIAPGELGRAVAFVMSEGRSQADHSQGAGRGSHGRP